MNDTKRKGIFFAVIGIGFGLFIGTPVHGPLLLSLVFLLAAIACHLLGNESN